MKKNSKSAKSFSISAYVEQALKLAEYEKDENGVVVASVPNVSGFFSQGENFEEARDNLRDAIEGNLVVALQLGFEIPQIAGVEIKEIDYAEIDAAQSQRGHSQTSGVRF
jgi:predicted RNase H-like HicB family nuclease